MLLLSPVSLRSDPLQAIDLTTMQTIQDVAAVPIMQPLVARQHSILWDTTHGTYLNYYPFTRYSTLTSMLIDSGYTIDLCATGVHTIDLSQYDIILVTVMNSWNSSYTQEEVDSLVSYYNQGRQRVILTGDANFCENTYIPNAHNVQFSYNIFNWLGANGGIFIMGDNSGCMNVNINPVANAFHMTAGISTISPSDLYFTNLAPHPIFNNVTQIYYRYAGAISASLPAEVIAWTDAMEPVIGLLDESVGIKEETKHITPPSSITIDPNPFIHNTVVNGIADGAEIQIFDVTGRLVHTTTISTFGATLKQGVYFVYIAGYTPAKVVKLR